MKWIVFVIAFAGLMHAQDFKPKRFDRAKFGLQVGFVALQTLDAAATEKGFSAPGWIEHNPLIPHSTAGRMSYFAATGVGILYASNWAARKGHRKLSLGILAGGILVEGYAATHSLIGLQR